MENTNPSNATETERFRQKIAGEAAGFWQQNQDRVLMPEKFLLGHRSLVWDEIRQFKHSNPDGSLRHFMTYYFALMAEIKEGRLLSEIAGLIVEIWGKVEAETHETNAPAAVEEAEMAFA